MRRASVTRVLVWVRHVSLALLAGCTGPNVQRELPAGHAANPSAPVAILPVLANPFSLLPTFERPRGDVAPAPMSGMQHGMEAMPGMEHGSGDTAAVQYTCPMHPEVIQDAMGSCPKCGMTLKPIPAAPHGQGEQKQ